jgi:MFS family permease
MKIDLVGPARRGLAMGLNEFAGYVAVSLAALASGYLAATYALRPQPFYLGVAFALAGLFLSLFFVRDSGGHAREEASLLGRETSPGFGAMFLNVSFKDRALSSASQAGMINNLNDGMTWGLFPLYFAGSGLPVGQVALLAATYPGLWGVAQLGTGALSDRIGRKSMIVAGMWTLLAAISDVAHPDWRASAVGVYRLWRDGGYAVGALLAGALADILGSNWAIGAVAGLTFASGVVVLGRMYETLPSLRRTAPHESSAERALA